METTKEDAALEASAEKDSKAPNVDVETLNKTEKQHRTTIYTHVSCTKHNMGHGHPEQPARITSILNSLKKEYANSTALGWKTARRVRRDDIESFHHKKHVDKMFRLFQLSQEKAIQAGLTDFNSQKSDATTLERCKLGEKSKGSKKKQPLDRVVIDADTNVMRFTEEAALYAAGSAVQAVDDVMCGRTVNAFCVVRPPGHHAERSKAMGFCFFNNAAIAAVHARDAYEEIRRVAVIDFDVHHGNGTQEGFENDPDLFYGSTHEGLDNPDFFPGTGKEHETGVANNIVNRPLPRGAGSDVFRRKYSEIMSSLIDFSPDFIVISAGFDAAVEDPLADIELEADDFYWATVEVLKIAHKHCNDRVVSVLEGGYNLRAISNAAVSHVKALLTTTFQDSWIDVISKQLGCINISSKENPKPLPVTPLRLSITSNRKSKSGASKTVKPIILRERSLSELLKLGNQKLKFSASRVSTASGQVVTDELLSTMKNDTLVIFS